jgi:hypothetical protein
MADLTKDEQLKVTTAITRSVFQLTTDPATGTTYCILRMPIEPHGQLSNADTGGMDISTIGTQAERDATLKWLAMAQDAIAKSKGFV